MTTGDKLKYFQEITTEDANQKSRKLLEDYQKGLETIFETFQQETLRQQEMQLTAGKESLQKEVNTELAEYQLKIRKGLGEKREEIKELLFHDVKQKLEEYKKTEGYYDYLVGHIKKALHFARKEAIEIYIDPEDLEKQEKLEQDTGVKIRISEYGFGGGVRAVIRSKRVLIDQSFETKLREEKMNFTFL